MEIREERAGDVLVLAPDGDLSSSEDSHALEQRLNAVVLNGDRFLVVDCARVTHLKSPALRALLLASRKVMRARGRLVLCGMTPKVHKAFSISGLDREFAVVPERDEALRLVLEPIRPRAGAKVSPPRVPAADVAVPAAEPEPEAAPRPLPEPPPAPPPAAHDSVAADADRLMAALGGALTPHASPSPVPPAHVAARMDQLAAALLKALDARPA